MTSDPQRLYDLLEWLTSNDGSKEEFDEVFALINNEVNETAVKASLLEGLRNVPFEAVGLERMDEILKGILASGKNRRETPVRRLFPWLWVAAVVVSLVLGSGAYFLFFNKPARETVKVRAYRSLHKTDVRPDTGAEASRPALSPE